MAIAVHELAVLVFKEADGGFQKYDKYPGEKPVRRKRKPTPFLLLPVADSGEQREQTSRLQTFNAQIQDIPGSLGAKNDARVLSLVRTQHKRL